MEIAKAVNLVVTRASPSLETLHRSWMLSPLVLASSFWPVAL